MFRFDNVVRYSEVDVNRQMTLSAILDLLQDSCTFQSEEIGLGVDYLKEHHRAWVLSSWQVVIKRYPKMGEKLTTYTWPYAFKSFMGYRNFKIEDEAGNVVVYANTVWVFLDTEKGRPVKAPQEVIERYAIEPPYEMECASRKLQLSENMQSKEQIRVQRFHIDTNLHVNNSKYVLMAEEYLPEGFKTGELRVEYKKEAVLADIICPKVSVEEHRVLVSLENETGTPYAIAEFLEETE
ncbi:MAG: acyl-[acyl-carrier-protein] thioesterase [Lachnospiraceae bacterium]|nr:acyl-[acyl-carrier-protein] thioesterase [Lachnospiraceae bacterium]